MQRLLAALPLALLIPLLLSGGWMQRRFPIVHDLHEKEANEVIVYLSNHSITAHKQRSGGQGGPVGNKEGLRFDVTVEESNSTRAISLLNQAGIPRVRTSDLLQIFSKQGWISSEHEERIRYQAGLASQISNTIRKIDGVIDADVHLSFPKDDGNPTASVYVKHQGALDSPNNRLAMKIKRIVTGSIGGLDIEDVTVISDRAMLADVELGKENWTKVWTISVMQSSVNRLRWLLGSATALLFALTATLLTFLWRANKLLSWNEFFALSQRDKE